VGTIEGGVGQNTIAPEASLIFEMRHLTRSDYEASEKAFYEIMEADYGSDIRVEATRRSFKPPMEELPGSKRLQAIVAEAGRELGIEIEFTTGAGGSDGNWIGSVGVPVLDALSGVGKGAHSRSEYIEIEPTLKRIDLLEKILRKFIEEKEG
jgi:glutamate carboxypeptidase